MTIKEDGVKKYDKKKKMNKKNLNNIISINKRKRS
jgi:hypothetical protein